jgi:hypothetical protein
MNFPNAKEKSSFCDRMRERRAAHPLSLTTSPDWKIGHLYHFPLRTLIQDTTSVSLVSCNHRPRASSTSPSSLPLLVRPSSPLPSLLQSVSKTKRTSLYMMIFATPVATLNFTYIRKSRLNLPGDLLSLVCVSLPPVQASAWLGRGGTKRGKPLRLLGCLCPSFPFLLLARFLC